MPVALVAYTIKGGWLGSVPVATAAASTAVTVTLARRRISTPWAPHARCDLLSAYTGTAEQSCKIDSYADLSKLRTRVDHDMYSKFEKVGRREIPEEIYPTCLERSGMG